MTAALLRANRRTFASLRRHRNYRLFFAGQVVSVSGTWMQNIAPLGWCSTVRLAAGCRAAGGLPVPALHALRPVRRRLRRPAGRAPHRDRTQIISMAIAAALAALTLAGVVTTWEVCCWPRCAARCSCCDAPARQALTFEMVGARRAAERGRAQLQPRERRACVGPAMGGVVVAVAGAGFCFALNAASFGAVLAGLALMRTSEMFPRTPTPSARRCCAGRARRSPTSADARGAHRACDRRPRSTFSFNFNVLLPVLARQTLGGGGPEAFGVLDGLLRGRRAGPAASTSATLGRASWPVLLAGTGVFGAAQLALAPVGGLAGASALLFVIWHLVHAVDVERQLDAAAARPRPPARRVIGLYFFAFNGAGPLGGLMAGGGWRRKGGTSAAFAVSGAASVATAGWGAAAPP